MGVIDAYNFKTLFVYYVKIFSVEEYFSEINFKKKIDFSCQRFGSYEKLVTEMATSMAGSHRWHQATFVSGGWRSSSNGG
jgi:hypothetical protein